MAREDPSISQRQQHVLYAAKGRSRVWKKGYKMNVGFGAQKSRKTR